MIFITNKYNNLCRAYGTSKSAMYWYQFDQMYHTDFQIRIHTEIFPIILACYFPSALLLFYFLIFMKKNIIYPMYLIYPFYFFYFSVLFQFFPYRNTVCIMIIRLCVYKIKATFTLFKIMNSMGRIVNN
jgi:hypothetical protein